MGRPDKKLTQRRSNPNTWPRPAWRWVRRPTCLPSSRARLKARA